MNIRIFISVLNERVPSVETIMQKRLEYSEDASMESSLATLERLRPEYLESNAYTDPVAELLYNTNLSRVDIGSINFYTETTIEGGRYKMFGAINDMYHLYIDMITSQIIVKESYTDTDKTDVMAQSLDQFLAFLILYQHYELNWIYETLLEDDFKESVDHLVSEGFSKRWVNELMQ